MSIVKPGPGDHWVWCARGHRTASRDTRRRWDGKLFCKEHFEPRIEEQEQAYEERPDDVSVDSETVNPYERYDFFKNRRAASAIPHLAIPNDAIPGIDIDNNTSYDVEIKIDVKATSL